MSNESVPLSRLVKAFVAEFDSKYAKLFKYLLLQSIHFSSVFFFFVKDSF